MHKTECRLILSDGTIFEGYSFGSIKESSGEVVFNTGMTGYPENLTDPSYCGQILVLTFPLIGNYGVPDEEKENGLLVNFESDKIHLNGIIVADYSELYSHHSAVKSLSDWLVEQNIPAITGIDTRALTKILREKGSMSGKITFNCAKNLIIEEEQPINLLPQVSVKEPIVYQPFSNVKKIDKKIVLVDCGVKNNIIRAFLQRGIEVIRVPWDYDFNAVEADGIVISNGPGDPMMAVATIKHTVEAFKKSRPILGICLGSQIMGLAAGAETYKLKYGHRGQNQPCVETGSRRCYITSQNHGYAVDSKTMPEDWREWFYNNNDDSNEGIIHISKPFFGAQFHPEASPGPDDSEFIFDIFVRAM